MKVAIPHLYAEYGRYIDEFRAIPYYMDCLKPVERRILVGLNSIGKNKFVKSARVIGDIIGKYHPHGDLSTYGALVGLVRRGFAEGQGNWGSSSYEDTDPAAFRYTETKANSFLTKLAFEFIKFVPWHDPENIQYEQPKYLPCPVPIGLVGSGFISGISFHTTKMPRYSIFDLTKRLIYLFKKEVDPKTPNEIIVPAFDNCDVYETNPGDFEKILINGEGSITVIPKMTVQPDGVHIYGKPPEGFSPLKNNTDNPKRPDQRKYDVLDLTEHNKLEVLCVPQNEVVDQPFIDLIFGLITNKLNMLCNVVTDGGIVRKMSIDWLLLNSYKAWSKAYETKLNGEKISLQDRIFELGVIKIVQEIIENNKIRSKDILIQTFEQTYKLNYPTVSSDDIRSVCTKHRIDSLLNHSTDTTATQNKLNSVEALLNNMAKSSYDKMASMIPIN